jgi:hypothetical protein
MEPGESKGGGVIVASFAGVCNLLFAFVLIAGAFLVAPAVFLYFLPGILWGIVAFLLMKGSRIAAAMLSMALMLLFLLFLYVGLHERLFLNPWFFIIGGVLIVLFLITKLAGKVLSQSYKPWR